jgi:putative serine protease PepD
MKVTQRARTAGVAAALAAVIGGGGFTVGTATAEPGRASSPAAATAQPAAAAGSGYADVARQVPPIKPDNSGGALVNTSGQVIGIPTAAASSQHGGQAQGIGFAIPANLARDVAGQLITDGHVTSTHRAATGAQFAAVTASDGTPVGAGIVAVTPGGPADKADLRAGDVIQATERARTPDAAALAQAAAAKDPGQAATVTVNRGGRTLTAHVILAELPGD